MHRATTVPRLAVLALAVTILAAACGGSSSTTSTTTIPARNDPPGSWTVLVYMAGDNNLEPAALRDIEQMKQTKGTDFVVFLDRSPAHTSAGTLGAGNFTDAVVSHIRDGRVTKLADLGEVDTGDRATLTAFIELGLTRFHNDRNALVIWDHGGAWRGSAWDDSSNGSNLTLAETATAMREGLRSAQIDRFDLIGFDACLMATYEVAAAVEPHAEVLVASEELEPGSGWNWAALSTPSKGLSIVEMADTILDGYLAETSANGESIVTMSAIDLRRLAPLAEASDALASAMNDRAREAIGRIGFARNRSLSFGRSPDPTSDYWSVDLGSLSSELEHVDGLETVAADLHDAVHAAVLRRVDGAPVARAGGIAAYFPPLRSLYSTDYDLGGFAPAWLGVLRSYYAAGAAVPASKMPTFVISGQVLPPTAVIADAESIELLAKVTAQTGGNVIDATIQWGTIGGYGGIDWFGQMNAVVAGDTVSGAYTWDQLVLSDGTRSVQAYASLDRDAEGRLRSIVIPIVFTRADESASGTLQLTFVDEQITAQTIFVETGAAISAIDPAPGDVIVPLVLHQDPNSNATRWMATPGGSLAADPSSFTIDYGPMPPSTPLMLRLLITDIDGNTDQVLYRTTSP